MDHRLMILGSVVLCAAVGAALGRATGDVTLVTTTFAAVGGVIGERIVGRRDDGPTSCTA